MKRILGRIKEKEVVIFVEKDSEGGEEEIVFTSPNDEDFFFVVNAKQLYSIIV